MTTLDLTYNRDGVGLSPAGGGHDVHASNVPLLGE